MSQVKDPQTEKNISIAHAIQAVQAHGFATVPSGNPFDGFEYYIAKGSSPLLRIPKRVLPLALRVAAAGNASNPSDPKSINEILMNLRYILEPEVLHNALQVPDVEAYRYLFQKMAEGSSSKTPYDEAEMKNSQTTTVHFIIDEQPLTPQTLATAFTALTELTTKLWLIAKHRLADLIEYTQTKDVRFANEAGLTFAWIRYNSPFDFGLNFDISATNVAEGTMTIVDGLAQKGAKREQLEIANQAALQKIKEDEKKSELERTKEELAIERERITLLKETLEVQKQGIEYALEIAEKVVDKLYPNADPETKGMLMRTLLPNILQLDTIKGLTLALPIPQSDHPETKENEGR